MFVSDNDDQHEDFGIAPWAKYTMGITKKGTREGPLANYDPEEASDRYYHPVCEVMTGYKNVRCIYIVYKLYIYILICLE